MRLDRPPEIVIAAIANSRTPKFTKLPAVFFVTAFEPDHAVNINRAGRKGSMILPGMSMFILETEPAGYIVYAANEAEKAADVTLVDVRAFVEGAQGPVLTAVTMADREYGAGGLIGKTTRNTVPCPI